MKNQKLFRATSLRLQCYDYSQPGYYFITMCIQNREHLFGRVKQGAMILNEFGEIGLEFWNQIEGRFPQCRTRSFVVMPNHIHGIIEISQYPTLVGTIHEMYPTKNNNSNLESVGTIHELSLRTTNDTENEIIRKKRRKMLLPMVIGWYKMNVSRQINVTRQTPGTPVWQRNYYEHIIRDQKSFLNISNYIYWNPQKWDKDRFKTD